MAQVSSGTVLREARERKGYDLATVARRLRIRPDILKAIENSDFAGMPPRGYARNMINAYARLLGLNPTEIVNMYLDEAYAMQVRRARSTAPSNNNFEMGPASRRSRSNSHSNSDDDYDNGAYSRSSSKRTRASYSPDKYEHRRGLTRDLYDDRTEFARHNYGFNDGRTMEPDDWRSPDRKAHRTSTRAASAHESTSPRFDFGSFADRSSRRQGHSSLGASNYTNFYSGPKAAGLFDSRLPLIIGAAVVLIIVIVILSFVIGNRNQASQDVSDLPVTGITDTTSAEDEKEITETTKPKAPTSIHVKYEVASGNSAYVEIYENDGDAQPLMLNGPITKEFDVTGKWVITTYAPDAIKLTVDDEEVEMKSDSNYNGMYTYTVDFQKYLEQWNTEHSVGTSSSSSTSTSSDNSSTGTSGSSTSTTSGTSTSGTSNSTSGTSTSTTGTSNTTSTAATTNVTTTTN